MMSPPLPFVLIEDQDGRRHAVRRQAIVAMVEDPPGTTTMLLSGSRVIVVEKDLGATLALVV